MCVFTGKWFIVINQKKVYTNRRFMETTEKQSLQKLSFRVSGMYCKNCQNIIEKELKKTPGIHKASVNYRSGHAVVTFDAGVIGFNKIQEVIESLGYQALEEGGKNQTLQSKMIPQIAGTLVIILALFMLMRTFTTSNLAAAFPLAREGMSYAMLIVIGLLTSVHCAAMCGGINLSQTLKTNEDGNEQITNGKKDVSSLLLPGVLYNGGRLVSYTAVGVLVGALGSAITLSGRFQGIVQLIAGVFMVIMGINMLGLFPFLRRIIPGMPKIFSIKIDGQKTRHGPLIVGFLNGFMPCGPLQAMQVYALSTGNPIKGGISMFLFCAGTIPLMFALGAVSGLLSGAKGRVFSRRVMQTGAILVTALGLVMFSYGWNLSGLTNSPDKTASAKPAGAPEKSIQDRRQIQGVEKAPETGPQGAGKFEPVIENGVQIVNSTLRSNRYPAITVQQGIPVRWTINAPPGSITGCNYSVILYEYNIQYDFKPGENVIEFTPARAGKFLYSCWMGMIRSTITVVAEKEG
jgi:sulfite exporter TauE/SafE/copper chaperone CopZ